MGHILMENRFGLAMDTRVTRATRTAEREAAFSMVADIPGVHRITVGEIKGYAVSQKVRKRVEEIFGWMKTDAWLRKVRYKGEEKID